MRCFASLSMTVLMSCYPCHAEQSKAESKHLYTYQC